MTFFFTPVDQKQCVIDRSHWLGDGFCDDGTNTESCNYDGGDCCGDSVSLDYCEDCLCHEGGVNPTGQNRCIININSWKSDGYCDDLANHEACNFDGGDCCDESTNTDYCEDCQCLEF